MPASKSYTRELPFLPPYDWETVLAFFRTHQLPFLETVDDSGYERAISTQSGLAWFRVERLTDRPALLLSLQNGTETDLTDIATSVRKMFDLDANPAVLLKAMKQDVFLSEFWAQHPGLRIARFFDRAEAMFSTVLGQLVSVKFGRVLLKELMQAAGASEIHPKTSEPISLFPSPRQLLEADLTSVRTSEKRRETLRSLAQVIHEGAFDRLPQDFKKDLRETLHRMPGIGTWTTEYIAMRGFGDDNAFPATDYALKQELRRHPGINVNAVRPWRSYAAIALWKSFAEAKHIPIQF